MTFANYRREIKLIEKQNCIETDLYSIIASVIRERENFKTLSLRDVSTRRRTKNGNEKLLWGVCGFPDFVILSEDYAGDKPCMEKIHGAIEIKGIGKEAQDIDKNIQLKGHLLWFKKVIYTNGLVWKYYEINPNDIICDKIKELQNNTYKKHEYTWSESDRELFNHLNELKPKTISLINGEGKVKDNEYNWDEKEWDNLLEQLSFINWEN